METSCPFAEVALVSEGVIVCRRHLSLARQHARDLIPTLKELLVEQGWSARSVDLLAVDVGPGSYTGLRVGVVTAKMFAYANKAKVCGIDSMTLLAMGSPVDRLSIWGIVDAQQNQLYTQRFVRDTPGDIPRSTSPMEVMPVEEWTRRLQQGDFVTGPGLAKCSGLLDERSTLAPPGQWSPTVDAMALELSRRSVRGEWDDPWRLAPLYLRDSSAQIRWDSGLSKPTHSPPT
jgi:tRNA threonylcarbamoyladenosine biosynthesis protein TsaB